MWKPAPPVNWCRYLMLSIIGTHSCKFRCSTCLSLGSSQTLGRAPYQRSGRYPATSVLVARASAIPKPSGVDRQILTQVSRALANFHVEQTAMHPPGRSVDGQPLHPDDLSVMVRGMR